MPINVDAKVFQAKEGKPVLEALTVDLYYRSNPTSWSLASLQESYCRLAYAAKLLNRELERIKAALLANGGGESNFASVGYGKLNVRPGNRKMEIIRRQDVFDFMGERAFVQAASLPYGATESQIGEENIIRMDNCGMVSVTQGPAIITHYMPK